MIEISSMIACPLFHCFNLYHANSFMVACGHGMHGMATHTVYLNVYLISKGALLWALKLYHSGIEIDGKEWQYGGPSDPTAKGLDSQSGVFWLPPQKAYPTLAERIRLGTVKLSQDELHTLIVGFMNAPEWMQSKYDALGHNCNHFSMAFARALCKDFVLPAWINRLADVGHQVVPVMARSLIGTYSRYAKPL